MERGVVINQIYQLREFLNRANKKSNQETELEFKIERDLRGQYGLYAISKNNYEAHRIILAIRNKNKYWKSAGFTALLQLEEFCSRLLNESQSQIGSNTNSEHMTSKEIIVMQKIISEKIKMLLLSAGYEP